MLSIDYPYQPSNWRARSAVPRAVIGLIMSIVLLIALLVWGISSLRQPATDEIVSMACGWGAVIGLAALIVWQALLALSNALIVTASFALSADVLTITLAGRWPVQIARADIVADKTLAVWYRLGRPQRIKAPIIRPRRRMPIATFVPARRVGRLGAIFWMVARMYAGREARYGFVVTPDHQRSESLLEALRHQP